LNVTVNNFLTLLSQNQHTGLNNTHWAQLISKSMHINDIVKPQWNWPLDLDVVKKKLKNGLFIVNMFIDPCNHHEEYIVTELQKITDNFVVLSGDASYFIHPKKHICFFPFWYLSSKLSFTSIRADNKPRFYKLSSLNGRSRYHRIENFIKLKEKPYFDQLLFSMHNNFDIQNEKRETPYKFWNKDIVKKFESLLSDTEIKQGHTNDHSTVHPAYTDAYINYVTETSIVDGVIFPSEKTWKPFMSGQFGIWLSNPGHVEFLRAIGLDVFDDVFASHAYDCEPNLNQRIDQIHVLIDSIMSKDLTSVYQDTVARRQANVDLFYSNDFEKLLTSQCEDYHI
jgi:hypothetical protein